MQGTTKRERNRMMAAARRALALDPGPMMLLYLASVHIELGLDPDAVLPILEEVLRARPQGGTARTHLATLREKTGDRAGARAEWEALAAIDPEHPDAVYHACRLRLETDPEGAVAALRLLYEYDPPVVAPRAWALLAHVAARRGDPEGAREILAGALAAARARDPAGFPAFCVRVGEDFVKTGAPELLPLATQALEAGLEDAAVRRAPWERAGREGQLAFNLARVLWETGGEAARDRSRDLLLRAAGSGYEVPGAVWETAGMEPVPPPPVPPPRPFTAADLLLSVAAAAGIGAAMAGAWTLATSLPSRNAGTSPARA